MGKNGCEEIAAIFVKRVKPLCDGVLGKISEAISEHQTCGETGGFDVVEITVAS